MRALIQRVTRASVTVDPGTEREETVGSIGAGLLVLLGVTHGDDANVAAALAEKVAHLRVLDDDDGVMNHSLLQRGGEALVVSQFTLYGDTRKGRRPSWQGAAPPEVAEPLVEAFVAALRATGVPVATGRFRADMRVSLDNDGPVTVMVEIEPPTPVPDA